MPWTKENPDGQWLKCLLCNVKLRAAVRVMLHMLLVSIPNAVFFLRIMDVSHYYECYAPNRTNTRMTITKASVPFTVHAVLCIDDVAKEWQVTARLCHDSRSAAEVSSTDSRCLLHSPPCHSCVLFSSSPCSMLTPNHVSWFIRCLCRPLPSDSCVSATFDYVSPINLINAVFIKSQMAFTLEECALVRPCDCMSEYRSGVFTVVRHGCLMHCCQIRQG